MRAFDRLHNSERPLITTKISIPQISPGYIQRPRLTERIHQGVAGPLTLLSAPAGFGKTNLLIEWTQITDLPVAWLNIDTDDNDLNRLSHYLVGTLQTLEPQLGEEPLDFFQSIKSNGIEIGLSLLINEISVLNRHMVLVLDDFQALEKPTILQNLDFFLKQLPPNLHLIIASRTEPALDLALLRSKGRVVELGTDDLRFTSEEVALFFRQAMGLHIPTETVQVLEKRTDGWITGLQMAALSLQNQPDPTRFFSNFQGDARYLADFLAEEVLEQQPEEIRQFLLKSSILDTLNGPLCEAVVNPEAKPGYGVAMLNRLEHAKLFIIPLDTKHEWFRYHHLFADFLRHTQAEINPSEIPVLQKRAALWFEQDANLDEAFQYALASGDVEWTVNLIERNIETMIKTGEIFSLTHWIGKLPDEIIRERPRLSLSYAWGLVAAHQLDLAQYWINDVQQSLDQIEEQMQVASPVDKPNTPLNIENTGLWNVRGGLAICQSTLAMLNGNLKQAGEFSKQATYYLQEENPFVQSLLALDDSLYFILSGDTSKAIDSLRNTIKVARQANNLLVLIIATCQLAEMQTLQGQLSQAWVTLQKAQLLTMGPEGKPLPLTGLVDIEFGEILYERDELEKANIYLERGCQTTQSFWSISSLDGLTTLARLRQTFGDIPGAQKIIEEAYLTALSTESSQWDDVVVCAVAVRLALQRGDLAEAESWWNKGDFFDLTWQIAFENYPYNVFEYLLLTQARFLLKISLDTGDTKNLSRALELLEILLVETERFQRLTSQIEVLVLKASILHILGNGQAENILLQALALGEPEGYRRIYLDEGHYLLELLIECQSAQSTCNSYLPSTSFINGLIKTIKSTDSSGQIPRQFIPSQVDQITVVEDGFPITLTTREMEVLELIAEGKSNQEISAQLYLALNTVKRHAYNIYTKLEVNKRTQAVSKARKLGLLPK